MVARVGFVLCLVGVHTSHVWAQRDGAVRFAPAWSHPLGTFGLYVPNGVGGSGMVRRRLSHGPVHAWASVAYLQFPATTRLRPYGSPTSPFKFHLTTGSKILTLTSGVGLCLCDGGWSGSLDVGGGVARFTNTSAVSGIYDIDPFARAAAFADMTWTMVGGAALARRIAGGDTPVSLEASARFEWFGPTRYLRDGPFPVGTISGVYLKPSRMPTSLVTLALGLAMTFPAASARGADVPR